MRVAFDTSVLVPALVPVHPHHLAARSWLAAARDARIEALMTSHAVAELWSVLTRLPLRPRLSPDGARRAVEGLRRIVEVGALEAADYDRALERCAERGLRSGAVFDALHLVAAERNGCSVLLTINTADFVRFALIEGPRITSPLGMAPP